MNFKANKFYQKTEKAGFAKFGIRLTWNEFWDCGIDLLLIILI